MENIIAPLIVALIAIGSTLIKRGSFKEESQSDVNRRMKPGKKLRRGTERRTMYRRSKNRGYAHRESLQQNRTMKEKEPHFLENINQKEMGLRRNKKPSDQLELKKQFNKRGLRQSIVMAEVLGPPRGKRPYSPARH